MARWNILGGQAEPGPYCSCLFSTSRFPEVTKARYLIGNPLEAIHCGAKGSIFRAEDHRHHWQVINDLLLRVCVESLAREHIVHGASLIEQRINPLALVLHRVCKSLAVKQNVEQPV